MKTANELKYLAEKYGWTIGPLTRGGINRMTADESDFHSRFNADEFNRAWKEDSVKAQEAKNKAEKDAKRFWKNLATDDEVTEASQEVHIFCYAFPQFIKNAANCEALNDWLGERNLPMTARNLVTGFQALGAQGKLTLNPSALGIGSETEISGNRLARHPQLWRLLEPAEIAEDQELLAQRKMSADEWRNQHLQEWNVPAKVVEAWEKSVATFRHNHPEYLPTEENGDKMRAFIRANGLQINPQGLEAAYNYLKTRGELELNTTAVVSGQTTKMVDYGEQPRGLQLPEKESLRHKINNMSAAEYLEWAKSPANRRAADAVGR